MSEKEEATMTTRVRWFGLITLLVVAIAVPLPALARVVHNDNGNGTWDPGEVPSHFSPYVFVGDANSVSIILGGGAANGWTNPGICLTTNPLANTLGGPLPFIIPIPPDASVVESPVFNLNFGNLGASIIVVSFSLRFSTDQATAPPASPTDSGSLSSFPNSLRSLDHAMVRLVTAGGDYNIFMIDPNGPQPSKGINVSTTVSGWPGVWSVLGDTAGGIPYLSGTPTLAVKSTIYPGGSEAASIQKNGSAKLRITINGEGAAFIHPSLVCVENIKVDVTP